MDTADTNMSALQLLSLAEKALSAGAPDQLHLPVEGSYTDDGALLTIDNLQMNVVTLRRFIYDEE